MLRVIGVGMQGRILLTEKRDSGEWFAMKTIRKVDIVDYSEGVLKTISNHVNHIFIVSLVYCLHNKHKIFFFFKFKKVVF